MKNIILLLVVIGLGLLTSCGNSSENSSSDEVLVDSVLHEGYIVVVSEVTEQDFDNYKEYLHKLKEIQKQEQLAEDKYLQQLKAVNIKSWQECMKLDTRRLKQVLDNTKSQEVILDVFGHKRGRIYLQFKNNIFFYIVGLPRDTYYQGVTADFLEWEEYRENNVNLSPYGKKFDNKNLNHILYKIQAYENFENSQPEYINMWNEFEHKKENLKKKFNLNNENIKLLEMSEVK